MAGERNYLRVPPDSTGKALTIKHQLKIYYAGKQVGDSWAVDAEYTLSLSGLRIEVHDWFESSTAAGYIMCTLHEDDRDSGLEPQVDDVIFSDIKVTSWQDIYSNQTAIVGGHPEHELSIDNTGSANIRFGEGQPQLDAFGKLRVSNATLLGDYVFAESVLANEFSFNQGHSGSSLTWDGQKRAAVLTVDSGSSTRTAYTSNTYHHYFAGSSHTAMMTLTVGSANHTNNLCAWGMFDVNNGFGFKRDVSGVLNVFVRSDVTGSVVDTDIPQSQWNGDKLNGTGASKMVIDITKDNLYWMDIQWLGAGRVRFGVYHNGQRIVCHEHQHNNRYPYPSTATGSLPLCFVNKNVGVTSGSHELSIFCAAVYTESNFRDVRDFAQVDRSAAEGVIPTGTDKDYDYLLAVFAPDINLPNGKPNRTIYFPVHLNIDARDDSGLEVPVKVELYAEPVTSDLVFNKTNPLSTVRKSTAGTYHGGGFELFARVGTGSHDHDLSPIYTNMSKSGIKNYAESGGFREYNVANITQESPAKITFADPTTLEALGQLPFREKVGYGVMIHDAKVDAGATAPYDTDWFYLKVLDATTALMYTDEALTIPFDNTAQGVYVANSGRMHGYYGTDFHWAIVVHKVGTLWDNKNVNVRVDVTWKEIRQG